MYKHNICYTYISFCWSGCWFARAGVEFGRGGREVLVRVHHQVKCSVTFGWFGHLLCRSDVHLCSTLRCALWCSWVYMRHPTTDHEGIVVLCDEHVLSKPDGTTLNASLCVLYGNVRAMKIYVIKWNGYERSEIVCALDKTGRPVVTNTQPREQLRDRITSNTDHIAWITLFLCTPLRLHTRWLTVQR